MKKQNTFYCCIFLMTALITSCSDKPSKEAATATSTTAVHEKVIPVDSLVTAWKNSWNEQDIQAVSNTFSEEVVLLSDGNKIVGRDSVRNKWVSTNIPVSTNLNFQKIVSGATPKMAFYTGFYTLDLTLNDSTRVEDGNFSFIWEKQADNSVKMEMIHLGEMP